MMRPWRWILELRRRLVIVRARSRLEQLQEQAVKVSDEFAAADLIDEVNALLGRLEERAVIPRSERLAMSQEWVRSFVRKGLPGLYRKKDAKAIAELGSFLKSG